MEEKTAAGRVIVISGPSGAGKSTLLKELLARCDKLVPSVSATTRAPRPGEVNGRDYYFLSEEEFQRRRRHGDFLECAEVFNRGSWYGTLTDEVAPRLAAGKWVVLEIDVQGAQAVMREFPHAVSIFIRPQAPEELERRLRGRGTESESSVARRLEVARRELSFADRYAHIVVNDQVDRAADEICDILTRVGEPTT
jgi:guanylate kinase